MNISKLLKEPRIRIVVPDAKPFKKYYIASQNKTFWAYNESDTIEVATEDLIRQLELKI